MKSLEQATYHDPAVPSGIVRAPYLVELISRDTTTPELERAIRRDRSALPSNPVFRPIESCGPGLSRALAEAIWAPRNGRSFVWHTDELARNDQELTTGNVVAYAENVSLTDPLQCHHVANEDPLGQLCGLGYSPETKQLKEAKHSDHHVQVTMETHYRT